MKFAHHANDTYEHPVIRQTSPNFLMSDLEIHPPIYVRPAATTDKQSDRRADIVYAIRLALPNARDLSGVCVVTQ